MIIFLIGHDFKYETEATVKLFFPAMRFTFCTEDVPCEEDFIRTSLAGETILAESSLSGVFRRSEAQLPRHADKRTAEHALCTLLYEHLTEATGITPPWGMMTGIRPVRMLTAAVEQGSTLEDAVQAMGQTYRVSEQKLALAKETARVQLPLLGRLGPDVVSLYISIPFCPSRCSYCSFVSHSIAEAGKLIPAYVDCLCRELAIWGELIRRLELKLDTVYIGGGTPTAISAEQLGQIMDAVRANMHMEPVREYTVEAGRPDTITPEKLEVIRSHGATRISINPQTLNDEVLRAIGRKHTAQQAVDAFRLARSLGFANINMDLIAGLPEDTPDSFRDTLDRVIALDPESITVHTLTLKRSAALYAQGGSQIANPASAMVDYSVRRLPEAGYRPYYLYRQKNTLENLENVGYAKPGFESLYNILIMDETQTILGAGCAASTKLVTPDGQITRIHNHKFPYEYIGRFDSLMEKKQQIDQILGGNSHGA
ncbi:coproporphyrinogen dehydrogenase HemZ [Ruminococcus sp.]|uniref:coproporphyrinogen dehydrogenase HemZ n=1 Tax=Ruminococcus sp. TaxID=41978 RepID=UPI003F00F391